MPAAAEQTQFQHKTATNPPSSFILHPARTLHPKAFDRCQLLNNGRGATSRAPFQVNFPARVHWKYSHSSEKNGMGKNGSSPIFFDQSEKFI
jgi:hypothetical protein